MWRFAGNEDQEGIEMINKEPSDEVEEKILKCFVDARSTNIKSDLLIL